GDNGTGRNLATINLTTDEAVVCLTNSENGPAVFREIAEPIVGDLSAIGQWLSIREELPLYTRAKESPTQEMNQHLQEQTQIKPTDEVATIGQQEKEQKPSDLGLF
ncbi:TPA: serine hydrolase, partial [Legionella pneumophila subsp. pneumophila]|nr:serine hydrolase [Legionella pneumophila subsp. pneumophila]